MPAHIQLRRGTTVSWATENPILFSGEPGFEKDTRKLKIGDGRTPWNDLPYSSTDGFELPPDQASLAEHINAAEPHPVYDDGPSLFLLYQNAKV